MGMRLFISVNFSSGTIRQLEAWQDGLRQAGVSGHWRRGENLHVTLKFLDEVDIARLPGLLKVLAHCSSQPQTTASAAFIGGLGVFPHLSRPRILWAGLACPPLVAFQSRLEHSLAPLGFSVEARPFTPHITLASGKIAGVTASLLEQGETTCIKEPLQFFHLMESRVEAGRRMYRSIARFELPFRH